jgi:hypothetical protein
MLVAIALPSAGRIVVDASTTPPTRRAVWGFWECFTSIAVAAVSLGCIFVSMWRRWDFEIVGWALLVVFILASGM